VLPIGLKRFFGILNGLLYIDQLSIIAGGAIVAITIYIWKKKKEGS